MRINALNGLAVCDPANAISKAKASQATKAELAYLESLIEQLRGRTDRYITASIRKKALTKAGAVK